MQRHEQICTQPARYLEALFQNQKAVLFAGQGHAQSALAQDLVSKRCCESEDNVLFAIASAACTGIVAAMSRVDDH